MLKFRRLFALSLLTFALSACGGGGSTTTTTTAGNNNNNNDGTSNDTGPGTFGDRTSIVVVVNPVYNAGSVTPVASGATRGDISVAMAATTFATATDASGQAVLVDVPTGDQNLTIGGQNLPISIVNAKENYDVVVSLNGNVATYIVEPIRYPIGGDVVSVAPGGDIAAAAVNDNTIVMLEAGEYPGNFELKATNVLVFGKWSPTDGPLSKVNGDVTVRGGENRMRGVEVTGKIISNANGFSAAFNKFGGANITGNSVTLIRNVFPKDGNVTVPSSNSVLVDNANIP